jgi:hypothetical protein
MQGEVLVWSKEKQKRRFKHGHELIRVDITMGLEKVPTPNPRDIEHFNSSELAISPEVVTAALTHSIQRTWRQGRAVTVSNSDNDGIAMLIQVLWDNDTSTGRAIVRYEDGRDSTVPLHQVGPLVSIGNYVCVSMGPSRGTVGYVIDIDANNLATVVPRVDMEDVTKPKVKSLLYISLLFTYGLY